MPRNGSLLPKVLPTSFLAATRLANASTVRRKGCVVGRVGVPVRAMRFRALSPSICSAPERESGRVHAPLWRKELVKRERVLRALPNCIRLQAGSTGKVGEYIDGSLNCDALRYTSVALAFSSRHPSAVCGLVVPIVVDTVNAIADGTRPHVIEEGGKTAPPPRANTYPAAAIVRELSRSGLFATADHAAPDRIERMGILERHACSLSSLHRTMKWYREANIA